MERLEDRALLSTITVSTLADTGPGTLRAAIEQANLDQAADTINFAPSTRGAIILSTALPDLAGNIYITGPGSSALTVTRSSATGTPAFEVFKVDKNSDVAISGLTISGGYTNSYLDQGPQGGGVYNDGTLSLVDCSITDNQANQGGGIYNDSGTLSVIGCTISRNMANTVVVFRRDPTGYLIRMISPGIGAGIYSSGVCTVINSTITGNSATWYGGGIYGSGQFDVRAATIDANSAGLDGGGVYFTALPIPRVPGNPSLTSSNSIYDNPDGGNLHGDFTSQDHNLFSDTAEGHYSATDLINTDPLLGPLMDNGGPTLTQALLPGSPAIDAGSTLPGITTDQRGLPRPQGSAADIGAFEVQLPPTVLGVQRRGVHLQPTTLLVIFSKPMNVASVNKPSNYRLVAAGPDHRFGTRDDRAIRIRSVHYEVSSYAVSLRPFHRLPLRGTYQLTIQGIPPTGLNDTAGLFLDGTGAGQQGSNDVVRIDNKLLVPPIVNHGRRTQAVPTAGEQKRLESHQRPL